MIVRKKALNSISMMRRTHAVIAIALVFVLLGEAHAVPQSQSRASCLLQALNRLLGKNRVEVATDSVSESENRIESLDDLLFAFTKGFLPDLTQPQQRQAFEIYRKMRFGDPNTELNYGTTEEVANILKKNPKLEKEPFRNYIIQLKKKIYPVTEELKSYLDSQVVGAAQARSNLFQVEANSGYWKKVFQYDESQELSELKKIEGISSDATPEKKAAYRQMMKELKENLKAQWMEFLDAKLPPLLRSKLLDQSRTLKERATELYQILRAERERMLDPQSVQQGSHLPVDIRAISQAIVDLIHMMGFQDPVVSNGIKSSNGMERLSAYRQVLDERNRFAQELGFRQGFEQVMREIARPAGVTLPSGVSLELDGVENSTFLKKLEQGIFAGVRVDHSDQGSMSTETIRHLSLVESPFRSCVGGSDCSSRSYLTTALDPNYHYFTITDETGTSSGQVTLVLGEGDLQGKKMKVAFLDKIQNVPNSDISLMLEAIRRSIEEKGYQLVIPDEVGDHNGISNDDVIRSFVDKKVKRDLEQSVLNFKPHLHQYQFPHGLSRADQGLPGHVFAPLVLSEGIEITPGKMILPWKINGLNRGFDLNLLAKASVKLKESSKLEDRLRYIPSMKMLIKAGLKVDPEFDATLEKWLSNPNESFQLRKQVLLFQWIERSKWLSKLLTSFSRNEQVQLLHNFLDTPRYRDLILRDEEQVLHSIVIARGSKKVREPLLVSYLGRDPAPSLPTISKMMGRILDASDVTDSVALDLLQELKELSSPISINQILKIKKISKGTSVETFLIDQLLEKHLENTESQNKLGQILVQSLNVHGSLKEEVAKNLVDNLRDTPLSQ